MALREGNTVYKLDLKAGTLHHIAGTGEKGFSGHGGPARQATLSGPKGLSIGPDGNVYLADTESHSVRVIDMPPEYPGAWWPALESEATVPTETPRTAGWPDRTAYLWTGMEPFMSATAKPTG